MTSGTYDFLQDLCQRSAAAVISQAGVRSKPLNAFLRRVLSAPPGEPGSFLADPVLEGAFGWRIAPETLSDLSGGLLSEELVSALDRNIPLFPNERDERYRLAQSIHPFRHQLDSWNTLLAEAPSSVLVTSGTGSGKTECFLVPILEDLIRRSQNGGRLRGVRALMLYPLNALINSQRDRLLDWTHDFDGRVRFCLYNGGTPEQVTAAEARRFPSEVRDRTTLRADTPPILVTNITMLEYMLIRQIDSPILEQSKGKLGWIVLDEAHTYVGSQAAEIALLLRRVLEAFEVKASEVRFVATSATIGSGEAVEGELRRFLADMAGISTSQVRLIVGQRDIPKLPVASLQLDRLDTSTFGSLPVKEQTQHLVGAQPFRRVRERLASGEPLTLSDAAKVLLGDTKKRESALQAVETASQLLVDGNRLLPVRLHLFHRAQPGLWVCANPNCAGREDCELNEEVWPWGAVYVSEREKCTHCESIVFEMAACVDCGEPHLLAEEVNGNRLVQFRTHEQEDEFAQGSEIAIGDVGDADDPDDEDPQALAPVEVSDRRLILGQGDAAFGWRISINPATGEILDTRSGEALELRVSDGSQCSSCDASETHRRPEFLRRFRFGAPFLLGNVIPNLLEHLPERQDAGPAHPLPWNGRQLISFTDSRQGTARFAARLQQDAERNFVRSVIYHGIQSDELPDEVRVQIEEIDRQLRQLEPLKETPGVREVYDDSVRRRAELLDSTRAGVSWSAMVGTLANHPDFEHWVQGAVWAWRDDRFQDSERLGHALLLRELRRRPKLANSAETMGLARLRFDVIERLEERHLPADFSSAGRTISDWKSFLRYLVTHFVRENLAVQVDREDVRWLGMRLPVTSVLSPSFDGTPANLERRWPLARPVGRPANAILLLSRILHHDAANAEGRDRLNACMNAAWSHLQPVLEPRQGSNGFQVNMRSARIEPVADAWLCPITQTVLDNTVCGMSPYQPLRPEFATMDCQAIKLPKLRTSFPADAAHGEKAAQWLNAEPALDQLRQAGVWSDLHDRIARFERPYLAAEHSAQQSSQLLRYYESEFRKGRLNLLSCSTTMEMGVDIGGLAAVVNTNVPPSPANYRQRVGRAGRRGEAMSLALTLVRNEPLGWATFVDPKRPLTASLRTPQVRLDSPIVIQRHVNAYLLSAFLREGQQEELHKLQSGVFFGRIMEQQSLQRRSPSVADRFVRWCLNDEEIPSRVSEGLWRIVWGTALERQVDLLGECATLMGSLQTVWRGEVDALAEELESFAEGEAARKRVQNQLRRLTFGYLLGELAGRSFLPAYGYPTDVVPFLLPMNRKNNRLSGSQDSYDDNRFQLRDSPTRELSVAIRDYAPGAEVVLDGLVYRSAGVRLNWRRPDDDSRLPQALRWAWRCQACNASGDASSQPSHCAECGSQNLNHREYLQPAGFTIDTADRPHTDVTQTYFVRPAEPNISANEGQWAPLPNPEVGRVRVSRTGSVFHSTLGQSGHGYALCMHCGRAEPELPPTPEGPRPLSERMAQHRPLRGGQLVCSGTSLPFAIRRHLALGAFSQTDVFELQAFPLRGRRVHEQAAYSLAVALREALCRDLGVENGEVGWAALFRTGPDGQGCWSIFLYDHAAGGSGLSVQAAERVYDLLLAADRLLDCSNDGCLDACASCVLTADSRYHVEKLDRRSALSVLREQILPILHMPTSLQVFGESSAIEVSEASGAISEHLKPGGLLQVILAGDEDVWDFSRWSARILIDRALHAGCQVQLLVEDGAIGRLATGQVRLLQSLAVRPGLSVHSFNGAPDLADWDLLAVVKNADRAIGWATGDQSALSPNDFWGRAADAPMVRGPFRQLDCGEAMQIEAFKPAIGADVREITIGKELDGIVSEFGERFWKLIQVAVPDTRQLLARTDLVNVGYSDRYLLSPLVTRMMFEVVRRIPGVSEGSYISIASLSARRNSPPRYAGRIHDDWAVTEDRRGVTAQLFAEVGLQAELSLRERTELPHDRRLTLEWGDGSSLQVRLDQGFGFWRSGRTLPFDFSSPARDQATHLHRVRFPISHTSEQETVLSIGPIIIAAQ